MDISLTAGRIFRRTNKEGIGLIGVVEVPEALETEAVHRCALSGGTLLVDGQNGVALIAPGGDPVPRELVREECASGIIYHQFESDSAGGQQLFFRQSVLPSSTPGMKWCYVVGARRMQIPQLPVDGLYALGERLERIPVEDGFGRGLTLAQAFREPVWGPTGEFGLAHVLEVGYYHEYVADDRKKNARKDPQFAAYMKAMNENGLGEPLLYYTASQRAEREALASRVINQLLDAEDVHEISRPRG